MSKEDRRILELSRKVSLNFALVTLLSFLYTVIKNVLFVSLIIFIMFVAYYEITYVTTVING